MGNNLARPTARPASIAVPDNLGPAMQALTESQRAYVVALLETGGNQTQAAAIAGYGGTEQARKTAGWRLSRHQGVLAAIREEADRRIRSSALLATRALIEIANDPMNKNRYKAAVEILNRSGMIVATEHKVIVEDNREQREIEREIVALAKAQGLDPKKLLGKDVVDAEWTEVKEEGLSSEGLEDLL